MIGTLINALTVLMGGTLGVLLGQRFPRRMQETIFASLGLFTLFIGFSSAMATGNPLIALGSLIVGALIGEALDLEEKLERFGRLAAAGFKPGTAGGRRPFPFCRRLCHRQHCLLRWPVDHPGGD
jgi:uncharacterized protein